jgi:Ca-activated chloride channel homolog
MRISILAILLISCLAAIAQAINGYIKQGNQLYKQSQFDLAEAQYRLALEEDPASREALFNLANALHQQKKYDQAGQVLDQLQGLAKDSTTLSMAAYNQGVGHTRQKNLEESIEKYKQALRMNPEDQQARENLQKALREQKQNQSSQQKQSSNMDQSEADQKLKLLQQKERQIQQRVRKNQQGGGSQSKDW